MIKMLLEQKANPNSKTKQARAEVNTDKHSTSDGLVLRMGVSQTVVADLINVQHLKSVRFWDGRKNDLSGQPVASVCFSDLI